MHGTESVGKVYSMYHVSDEEEAKDNERDTFALYAMNGWRKGDAPDV